MCLEGADNLPAGADDPHVAIVAAEEKAVGAGADAGDRVAFEKGARVVVGRELDLADVEEVKGLPLFWGSEMEISRPGEEAGGVGRRTARDIVTRNFVQSGPWEIVIFT